MKPLIEAFNLTKVFGKACGSCIDLTNEDQNICPKCKSVVACANIELVVYSGEALGVVGESGSGKSTLVRMLGLELEPTAGFLRFHPWGEENLISVPPFVKKQIRSKLIGIVYQNPYQGLRMNLSAESNIAEKLLASGNRNLKFIKSKIEKLFEELDLPLDRRVNSVKDFSGGMQQKIQIAKALVSDPVLLLLDEPTTGLDPTIQAKLLDLIKGLYLKRKFTLIIVSHDLGVIRHLTDRLIVMKNGRVIEHGMTEQILEDPQHPYTQLLVNSQL